jgi:hypothetical protein
MNRETKTGVRRPGSSAPRTPSVTRFNMGHIPSIVRRQGSTVIEVVLRGTNQLFGILVEFISRTDSETDRKVSLSATRDRVVQQIPHGNRIFG